MPGIRTGPANIAAREEVLVLGFGRARPIVQPVVGVEAIVAGVEISGAMEIRVPDLAMLWITAGPFLIFRGEVRRQDLKLLNHVGIRVYRCGAVAARIRDVRAVRRDIKRSWSEGRLRYRHCLVRSGSHHRHCR